MNNNKYLDGFNIYYYKEVYSTNAEAFRLINEKAVRNEVIVIADKQKGGRGRSGKSWISPKGNFYASLIIDLSSKDWNIIPTFFSPLVTYLFDNNNKKTSELTKLTFITAVAIGNTLSSFIDESKIQYKWPNDILVDGKKISGILVEKRSNINWLVIGIGININCSPLLEATYINKYGNSISNTDLLKVLIINFNKLREHWLLKGFLSIKEIWMKKAFQMNKQISLRLSGELHKGIFVGIDDNGRLVLKKRDKDFFYYETGEFYMNIL